MNKFIPFLLVLLITTYSFSQSKYYELISKAHGFYYTGEYCKSVDKFVSAFKSDKARARDLVVASYSAALSTKNEIALDFLTQYFNQESNVYLDVESITSVSAYKNIKDTFQFKNIVDFAYKNNARLEPTLNNNLRIALEKLYEQDEKTRDMTIMDSLVAKHGFPSEPVSKYFKKNECSRQKESNSF